MNSPGVSHLYLPAQAPAGPHGRGKQACALLTASLPSVRSGRRQLQRGAVSLALVFPELSGFGWDPLSPGHVHTRGLPQLAQRTMRSEEEASETSSVDGGAAALLDDPRPEGA